jgi:autotransporter-associated beta strand protein
MTKNGTGTLTLSGANTYTGSTTINAGTLSLNGGSAIADTSAVTVSSGAVLNLGASETVGSIAGAGNIALGSYTLTSGGANSTTTLSGIISGTGGMTKNGTGTLTLSGANTYTGSTTINTGTLALGSNQNLGTISGAGNISLGSYTLTTNATSNTTLSGAISGTGALTKNGTGTLTLAGSNTYSGATTINVGTLKAGSTTGLSSGSAVSVAAGATLDLGGFNNTISSLSTATGTITNSGGTANLTITTVGSGAAQLFTGNLGVVLNTSTPFSNANNTYSGGTYLTNGRPLWSGNVGVGTPGALTNGIYGTGAFTIGNSTASTAQLYFQGQTFNNAIVVNSAQGTGGSELGAFRIAGGGTIAGAINANLADATFNSINAGQAASVTGAISGNSGVVIMTQSPGVLNITLNATSGANTYAGNTTISTANATLTLGKSDQISNGVGKGGLIINSGTFAMGGFSDTINGLSGNGTIDGVSGTPTLTVGDNDATSSFSGVIKNTTGNLSLTKTGNY